MKRYIILGTFLGMGGGQLYTRNKVDYLKKSGWKVDVYTGRTGELLIPDMSEYVHNYYSELDCNPFYTSKKRRNEIIQIVVGEEQYDEVIIESSKAPYAMWGELMARRNVAKHVIFNLDEEFPVYSKWYYQFINFKFNRKELVGIKETSLPDMFKTNKTFEQNEKYYLTFCCQNSFTNEINSDMEKINRSDINLACISRLDKGYILPMMKEVRNFACKHIEQTISFVLIGDATDQHILQDINTLFNNVNNFSLHIMGFLSPIPRKVLDLTDCFIGTAGSAVMTASAQKITIYVDTSTGVPRGITEGYYEKHICTEAIQGCHTLCEYFEYIFFQTDIEELQEEVSKKNHLVNDYMIEFDNHMNFILQGSAEKEYYDFDFSMIWKIIFGFIQLIGIKRVNFIIRLLRSIYRKTLKKIFLVFKLR